jgi:hypothetical protein
MKIPNFINTAFVDGNGVLTDVWGKTLNQLFDQMQQNISEEGFVIPSLTTTDIARLVNAPNGTLIIDSTLNVLKVKLAGTFRTITTT